jgi:hypothetical protein
MANKRTILVVYDLLCGALLEKLTVPAIVVKFLPPPPNETKGFISVFTIVCNLSLS